jgi:hypothetical protein
MAATVCNRRSPQKAKLPTGPAFHIARCPGCPVGSDTDCAARLAGRCRFAAEIDIREAGYRRNRKAFKLAACLNAATVGRK